MDNFVGLSGTEEHLKKLIDVVYVNVNKSAVSVFARDAVKCSWNCGKDSLPNFSKCIHLFGHGLSVKWGLGCTCEKG